MSAKAIEKLLIYGIHNNMLDKLDVPQVRNQLLDIMQLSEMYIGDLEEDYYESPRAILNELLEEAIEKNIIEDGPTNRDLFDAKIMSQLMPRQSELFKEFENIRINLGIEAATDYYYKLSKASNYIPMDRIAKNIVWESETEYGNLEITINLSKPEKDPKEIAKARSIPSLNYPKCLLCLENVGFAGNLNHPARNNHRVIPISLNSEEWYFQYSPYVYYNEHAIIFKGIHEPMKINRETFVRLLEFVEQFPHYFLGSNADLPIVGGSILSHDHFQGGHHTFPMAIAPSLKTYLHNSYEDITIDMVKWPLSVVRIAGKNKQKLVALSVHILEAWRNYSDEQVNIVSYTGNIPHNTITPIARVNEKGLFEVDLVLRNNRQSEEYPEGIFHPHRHLHHIKKENIGLIEVMGLAVLPPRLREELSLVSEVLSGVRSSKNLPEFMQQHLNWICELIQKYGTEVCEDKAKEIVKGEVSHKFSEVLECAGVFKMTETGKAAFNRFIKSLGTISN